MQLPDWRLAVCATHAAATMAAEALRTCHACSSMSERSPIVAGWKNVQAERVSGCRIACLLGRARFASRFGSSVSG